MRTLTITGCQIDLATGQVSFDDDRGDHLTTKERELLQYLANRPDQTVTQDELLHKVWEYRTTLRSRAVYYTMRRLRTKLEADPARPAHLLTVHGAGFRFVPTAAEPHESPPERAIAAPLSRLIGRTGDLAELRELAVEGALLTVHGTAGVGKTRLVRELLAEAAPHSAWFVDLSHAVTADGVWHALAEALQIHQPSPTLLANRVAAAAVVVFDNAEQVIEPLCDVLTTLRQHAGDACIIVTSRETLRLPGEQVWRLRPLRTHHAAELFVARARAAHRDWQPAASEADDIEALVRDLDGLPLAIELAAPRIRVMTVHAMRDRLADRCSMLARPARGVARKHATLEAALAGSWDLLEPYEQAALAQLSVCQGGLSLEAAEDILDLSAWPDAPWEVLVVEALFDKALLYEVERSESHCRFGLLATVRDFAARQRPEAEYAAARDRHLQHTLRWVNPMLRHIATSRGPALREAFCAEADNLVVAYRHAVQVGGGEALRTLTRVLSQAAMLRFSSSFAEELFADALASGHLDAAGRADVVCHRATQMLRLGRLAEASKQVRHTLETTPAEDIDDRTLVALLSTLAVMTSRRGEKAEARAMLERALSVAERTADPMLLAGTHSSLATTYADTDPARFADGSKRALEMVRGTDIDPSCPSRLAQNHAFALLKAGRTAEAVAELRTLIEEHERNDVQPQLAFCRGLMANAHLARGEYGDAERLARAALATARTVGNVVVQAVSAVTLIRSLNGLARYDDALMVAPEAEALARTSEHSQVVAEVWALAGEAAMHLGHVDEAASFHRRAVDLLATRSDTPNTAHDAVNALGQLINRRSAGHDTRGESRVSGSA